MTILRDGRTVGRSRVDAISPAEAVSLMAGRDVRTIFPGEAFSGEADGDRAPRCPAPPGSSPVVSAAPKR